MAPLNIHPSEFEQCIRIIASLPNGMYPNFICHNRYTITEYSNSNLLTPLRQEAMGLKEWSNPILNIDLHHNFCKHPVGEMREHRINL